MSLNALLVILLVWTVAGLLAAIALGKLIRAGNPDEEADLATPAGTVKYFRKSKDKPPAAAEKTLSAREHNRRHASG